MNISTSAIVENCTIGDGTKVWHFANLFGCDVGRNCNIGSYVEVQPNVQIGDRVVISTHSFICSLVTIEDDVFFGHGVVTINDINPPSRRRTGSESEWRRTLIRP